MSTVDEVRRLAGEGYWGRAIAQKLGVSAQRVHQIAKANGIVLPIYGQAAYDLRMRERAPPKSRALGSGNHVLSTQECGAICELLVAVDLISRGWLPYLPVRRNLRHDILAEKNDRLITLEVRAAHRKQDGTWSGNRTNHLNSMHLAFVITGEPVIYEPDLPNDPSAR